MIIRNLHIFEIASLRDAGRVLIYNPQTALCLSGVIKIKPLRGFFVANADNHCSHYPSHDVGLLNVSRLPFR